MTITIELASESEQQLCAEASALGTNAEALVLEAVTAHLQKPRPRSHSAEHLSAEETRLLSEINRGLSEATWQRYRDLVKQRQEEIITSEELTKLIRMTDTIEEDHVRRLHSVAELARLRETTLEALMKELGLWRSTDV